MQGSGRPGFNSTAPAVPALPGRLGALRLSRRAKRGDHRAFEEIFHRHHQELYRYCLAIVRDRDDAEDALQATMMAALRALPGEEREIDLRPWLFRIAHNESISLIRRRRATDELDERLADSAAASQDAEIATRERLRALVADLGRLPERQRSAIVMRELNGLSYEEIAGALDCAEGNARQAVYEARTALRELEEGRTMACEEVRRAISDRDGRRLRGRRLRAHLDGCDGCRAFEASIASRRADLDALFPPLPAATAGAILADLAGGGAGAGGGAAGAGAVGGAAAAGGGIAASAAVKGASLAAAVALAAGAAEFGGLIHLPNPAGGNSGAASAPATESSPAPPAAGAAGRSHDAARSAPSAAAAAGAKGGDGRNAGKDGDGRHGGDGKGGGHGGTGEGGGGSAATGSHSTTAPSSPAANGNGGNSASAPGQTGSSPGGGTADAPGQTGTAGSSATAPGHATSGPGNSADAPGQTGSAPPANGNAGGGNAGGSGGGSANGNAGAK